MIWIIGMMGSGKTTTGRLLARRLHLPFADSDHEVEASLGLTVRQLWERRGEQALRDAESAVVHRLADGPRQVVATGGGVILDPRNVEAMRHSGKVVWLRAEPAVLAARITGSARPLLDVDDVGAKLTELLTARTQLYQSASDLVVDTDRMTVREAVDAVAEAVA